MASAPKKHLLTRTALVCLLSAPLAIHTAAQDAGSSIVLTNWQTGENSVGTITLSGLSSSSGNLGGGSLFIADPGSVINTAGYGDLSFNGNGSLNLSSDGSISVGSLSVGNVSAGNVQWSTGGILTLSNTGILTSNFSGNLSVTGGSLVLTGDGTSPQVTNSGSLSINGSLNTLSVSGTSIPGSSLKAGWNSIVVLDPAGLRLPPATPAIPPPSSEIATQEVTVQSGSGILLRTAADLVASGPVSFQWLKNGTNIQGANSPTLFLPSTSTDSGGNYTLSIHTPAGTIVTPSTRLTVKPQRSIAVVQEAPVLVKTIKGVPATLPMSVSCDTFGGGVTTFQLFQKPATPGDQLKPLPLSGLVNAAGNLQLPLSRISESGEYVLKIQRTYADGTAAVSTESRPFTVQLGSWDAVAGMYEALLEESTPGNIRPADQAAYRGLVSFLVTKTGSVSGRLQYNEARLDPSNPNALSYAVVNQSFAGSMTAAPGETQKFVFTPRTALSETAPKLNLSVEVDMSTEPPLVQVKVQDKSSTGSANLSLGFQSCAANLRRTLLQAPGDLPAGSRFVITAQTVSSLGHPNLGFPNQTAYITAQISPGGKVLWNSRFPGYSGTGSASLNPSGDTRFRAALYEGRTTSSPKLFSTDSLLGEFNFQAGSSGSVRTATLGSEPLPSALERHSTKIVRTPPNASVPVVPPVSEVSRIEFHSADGCFWPGAKLPLPSFLPSGAPLQLSLKDSSVLDSAGQPATLAWAVTLSPLGTAKVSGVATNGILPPPLTLRFDREKGEWLGMYTLPGNVRRTLFGAASPCHLDPSVRSTGWAEAPPSSSHSTPPSQILWKLAVPTALNAR